MLKSTLLLLAFGTMMLFGAESRKDPVTTVASAPSEVLKLMFGGEKASPSQKIFLDFRYVEPNDPMFSAARDGLQAWNYDPSGGAAWNGSNGSIPADTLLEHGIAFRKGKVILKFAAPKAVVRIWCGDWFFGWRRMWGTDPLIQLKINGKIVYEEQMTPMNSYKEWCKLDEYVFSIKDNIWDRLVKPVLEEKTFEVDNPNGELSFEMNNILLTAMVVAPDLKTLNATAVAIEKERRQQFTGRYPWKPLPEERMPQTDRNDYLLFQKYGTDTIYPWSRPTEEELTDTIKVFAAQDEQEMFRFGILPLHDVEQLTLSIGDFIGPQGKIETAKCADFWRERYKEQGSQGMSGKIDNMSRLHPQSYVLQENRPQNAEAGIPRMYVLDVQVPKDAVPGEYYAPLTISEGNRIAGNAKLLLKVLPFKLKYEGSAPYSFQMFESLGWAAWKPGSNRDTIKKQLEDRCEFLYKYHFQTFRFEPWGWGYPSYFKYGSIVGNPGERNFIQTPEEEATMDWWFRQTTGKDRSGFYRIDTIYFMMNCGWRYTNVFNALHGANSGKYTAEIARQWDSDLKDIERIIRQVTALFHKKGYPEPWWELVGEIDNYGLQGMQEAARCAEVIRRAGALSYTCINGPLAYKAAPPLFDHVWANPSAPIDENLVANIRKYGHKFGNHNCGDERFQAGFQFWRTGGEGRYQETTFYIEFLLPYIYLPWNYNTALVYPSPDGSYRPIMNFLNYRDGRDDYLYLHTLESLMKNRSADSAAYKNAEQFLDRLRNKIHFDPRKYHVAKFDGVEGTASIDDDEWNAVSLERYRWKIATLIMALEKNK